MKDRELRFDRTKHILYSRKASRSVQHWLAEDFGPERGAMLWGDVQRQFLAYLKDAPAVGGKRNSHARGIYDGLLFFAWYVTVPKYPAPEVIQQRTADLFMGGFKTLGKVFNLNRKSHLWLASKIFQSVGDKDRRQAAAYPGGFHTVNEPFDRERGIIRYHFTRCPHAEFAKAHDLLDALPYCCNCDHIGLRCIGAGLIRHGTCGCGDRCDYLICGSENPILKAHPLTTVEHGLWVNK